MSITPINVGDARVYISEDGSAGSAVLLESATGYTFTSDSEGSSNIPTLGGGNQVVPGQDTDNYEISALFDAAAQQVLRDAKRNKTAIWIIIVWDEGAGPPATTAQGQKQQAKVLSYSFDNQADGDLKRATFTAQGEGTLTEFDTGDSMLPAT